MENSASESDEQNSVPAPRRRRSTFFEPIEEPVSEPKNSNENIAFEVCKQSQDLEEKHRQELLRYHDKLLSEKGLWKEEVYDRRRKYHNLRAECLRLAKLSIRSRVAFNVLSNEDINFLKNKSRLSRLADGKQELHKSVKQTVEMYRRVLELDDVLHGEMDDIINKATKDILESSNVDSNE